MKHKKSAGHQARKRFGQNFLHDKQIIQRIIQAINAHSDDNLVEIGPGLGALTEPLLQQVKQLQVIELDRDLVPILKTQFFTYQGLHIHQADALEFDFSQLASNLPLRIVGNLPYNISTPLIFHLLKSAHLIQDMHFMLQQEVVTRLSANPNNKNYGRLSIMVQYYCQVEPLFSVPPTAFNPAPKVDSAIVRLIPHQQKPHIAKDEAHFAQIVRTAFQMRRKTLRNNLKNNIDTEQLAKLGIDSHLRPENISLKDYVSISNALCCSGSP